MKIQVAWRRCAHKQWLARKCGEADQFAACWGRIWQSGALSGTEVEEWLPRLGDLLQSQAGMKAELARARGKHFLAERIVRDTTHLNGAVNDTNGVREGEPKATPSAWDSANNGSCVEVAAMWSTAHAWSWPPHGANPWSDICCSSWSGGFYIRGSAKAIGYFSARLATAFGPTSSSPVRRRLMNSVLSRMASLRTTITRKSKVMIARA